MVATGPWVLRRGLLCACFIAQMPREPIRCQARHLLQGSRLLKQMGRSWNDRQVFLSLDLFMLAKSGRLQH